MMAFEATINIFKNLFNIIDGILKETIPVRNPSVFILFIIIAILAAIIIRHTFVKFKDKEELKEYNKKRRLIRFFTVCIRIGVFFFLFIALASPFIIQERVVEGDMSITILADNSTSFELYDNTVAEELKKNLEIAFPATLNYIAQGDRSPIADGILSNLKGDDHILVISDGNSNEGKNLRELVMFLSNMNSTVSTLELEPQYSDTNVVIKGLEKVVRGTDAPFVAYATQIGEETPYHIKITLGTQVIIDEDTMGSQSYDFSKRLGEGTHKVTAEITVNGEDHFPENNIYYKTVEVLERPRVMVVSKKESYFYSLLLDIYNFAREDTIPEDLLEYSALILNDIPASDISIEDYEKISNFVINGSGLVVYGGQSSYDLGGYAGTPFETLLPVKSGESEKEQVKKEEVNIVLVIDVSGSTSGSAYGGDDSKVDVEKGLAFSILDYIKGESKVGVVAFNSEAYRVSDIMTLNQNMDLRDKIGRLQEGGGTDIAAALREAQFMLSTVKGSRNMIIISDGVTVSPGEALAETENAKRKGISVFTVGVGGDTFELLLKQMAAAGNGMYYRPTQSQRLKIIFGEPDEDDECSENKRKVIAINPNHFITFNIDLEAAISGYNYVVPRSTSIPLVATCHGKSIMTAWRYGLGRVVAMSTDDGSAWSGELLSAKNSEIITRMINWAIGDPMRLKDFKVIAEDSNVGEIIKITVKSKSQPVSNDVNFSKVGDDMYEGNFIAESPGFYDFFGTLVGVSYKKELEKTGISPELYNLVYATGGEIFQPDAIDEIINKTKSLSKRVETHEENMTWPFVLVALLLFLIEIFVRRIWENKG